MADVEVRQTDGGNGGANWLLVIVALVLVLLIAWFFFARGGQDQGTTDVDVEVPQADAPEIRVPEEIDVNVEGRGRPDGGR